MNKIKNKQMGPNQTWKVLHSKGNHQQNESTFYEMGEHASKWCNKQGFNFQNTQSSYNSASKKTPKNKQKTNTTQSKLA